MVPVQDHIPVRTDLFDFNRQKSGVAAEIHAGQIPAGISRSVLSQDGLYNLLEDAGEILEKARGTFCQEDS